MIYEDKENLTPFVSEDATAEPAEGEEEKTEETETEEK